MVRINPSTQAGTRAVMVYLAVQPQPGLRQGLFANGSIELQRQAALAVPVSAVRIDQAQPYVLALHDGKVVQRSVTLGARGTARFGAGPESAVEARSGIADGATVLRGTVGQVRDGTLVSVPAAPLAARAVPAVP